MTDHKPPTVEELVRRAHAGFPIIWEPGLCGIACDICTIAARMRELETQIDLVLSERDMHARDADGWCGKVREMEKQRDEARSEAENARLRGALDGTRHLV